MPPVKKPVQQPSEAQHRPSPMTRSQSGCRRRRRDAGPFPSAATRAGGGIRPVVFAVERGFRRRCHLAARARRRDSVLRRRRAVRGRPGGPRHSSIERPRRGSCSASASRTSRSPMDLTTLANVKAWLGLQGKPITAITRANPGVVTCPATGSSNQHRHLVLRHQRDDAAERSDGDVTVVDANSFSIGIDTTRTARTSSGGFVGSTMRCCSGDHRPVGEHQSILSRTFAQTAIATRATATARRR
jgi:hypothetical protein